MAAQQLKTSDLLLHLLQSSLEGDTAEVESYNLDFATTSALADLAALHREAEGVEAVLRRLEAREAELEQILLQLLERLPS